jgi:hypothetical protein
MFLIPLLILPLYRWYKDRKNRKHQSDTSSA